MIFKHITTYKKILFLFLPLLFGGFFAYKSFTASQTIAPTPTQTQIPTTTTLGNLQLHTAVEQYLLNQKDFSWQTQEGSYRFCAIENLDLSEGLFPLYLWTYCAEYTLENNTLVVLSGSSGPVKVQYPNELSFYDVRKFSHEKPRDGAFFATDISTLFPQELQEKIRSFDPATLIAQNDRRAQENILTWVTIEQAISTCDVAEVFQTHNRLITITLKNGEMLSAYEPSLDRVFELVTSSSNVCGNVTMATE